MAQGFRGVFNFCSCASHKIEGDAAARASTLRSLARTTAQPMNRCQRRSETGYSREAPLQQDASGEPIQPSRLNIGALGRGPIDSLRST